MEDDAYRSWETLSCPGSVLLREPSSARFGFYTADELRALSAKRITNAEQRDLLNRPLPGGLYDPAMGPTDAYESCVTCGLDYATCPGHFGHIDLYLPTYCPLLFPLTHQLLRAKCLSCDRLRAKPNRLKRYIDAFALIHAGHLADAARILDPSASDPANMDGGGGGGASRQPHLRGVSAASLAVLRRAGRAAPSSAPPCDSPHAVALRRSLFSALSKELAREKKCSHCGEKSPNITAQVVITPVVVVAACKLRCHVTRGSCCDPVLLMCTARPAPR